MIGDDMRPPCVVHMPNSSASERSQSSLPCGESDISRPLPLIAIDVAGGGVDGRRRPGDAVRRHVAGEQVVAVLPQELAGVGVEGTSAAPAGRAGADGVLQVQAIAEDDRCRTSAVGRPSRRGSHPWATTSPGRLVSVETPVRAGPRHSGQSATRPRPRRPASEPGTGRGEHEASFHGWIKGFS